MRVRAQARGRVAPERPRRHPKPSRSGRVRPGESESESEGESQGVRSEEALGEQASQRRHLTRVALPDRMLPAISVVAAHTTSLSRLSGAETIPVNHRCGSLAGRGTPGNHSCINSARLLWVLVSRGAYERITKKSEPDYAAGQRRCLRSTPSWPVPDPYWCTPPSHTRRRLTKLHEVRPAASVFDLQSDKPRQSDALAPNFQHYSTPHVPLPPIEP